MIVVVQTEFFQFAFQRLEVHAEIEQGAEEHIAADAAEQVEVEGFHFGDTRAFIWLAA